MDNQNELNGRTQHHWRGRDRTADVAALADKIAASIELFNADGRIVQLAENGELVNVNRAGLHELITKHICGMRAVKRGTRWVREYFSYEFAPLPPQRAPTAAQGLQTDENSREPDLTVLDEIFRHDLLGRIPRVI